MLWGVPQFSQCNDIAVIRVCPRKIEGAERQGIEWFMTRLVNLPLPNITPQKQGFNKALFRESTGFSPNM